MRCNILEVVTPLDPANIICVSNHCPPFPAIFHGPSTDPKRHTAFYDHSRMWLVFQDPFEVPKGWSSSQTASSSQATDRGTLRSERRSAQAPCMFIPSFLYAIFPHNFFRSKAPNYSNG